MFSSHGSFDKLMDPRRRRSLKWGRLPGQSFCCQVKYSSPQVLWIGFDENGNMWVQMLWTMLTATTTTTITTTMTTTTMWTTSTSQTTTTRGTMSTTSRFVLFLAFLGRLLWLLVSYGLSKKAPAITMLVNFPINKSDQNISGRKRRSEKATLMGRLTNAAMKKQSPVREAVKNVLADFVH